GIFGVAQYIAATLDGCDRIGFAVNKWQILPRQQQCRWATVTHRHAHADRPLYGANPCDGGFGRIARAPHMQVGYQAQAGGMLDRLMGGAVFAQADGVVRKYMHHRSEEHTSELQSREKLVCRL